MIFREIRVCELEDFLLSDLYKSSNIKPISRLRAISQANNPRALPSDVALILCYTDDNQLEGFVGMLPDEGFTPNGRFRFAWNSCWWVNPQSLENIAIKLLYKSIAAWKGNYLITDLTPHTKEILKHTGHFHFDEPEIGFRFFMRVSVAEVVRNKYPSLKKLVNLLRPIDLVYNCFSNLLQNKWLHNKTSKTIHYSVSNLSDIQVRQFINEHSPRGLTERGLNEFEWICHYPWLSTNTSENEYPFSSFSKTFESICLNVFQNETLIGIAMLTNRNNLYRLQYIIASEQAYSSVIEGVIKYLIKSKAHSIVIYNSEFVRGATAHQMPFLFQRQVSKELVYPKTLCELIPQNQFLQDGEGDVIFT